MSSSPFFISDVVFGPDGHVVVTNSSPDTADPAGLRLCQFPAYPEVPGGAIAQGESVVVPGQDLGGLDNESGELALYLRPDYGDPDAIACYVQWGSIGHKRQQTVTEAGVWEEGSFVDATGASRMAASGLDARSAGGWTVS